MDVAQKGEGHKKLGADQHPEYVFSLFLTRVFHFNLPRFSHPRNQGYRDNGSFSFPREEESYNRRKRRSASRGYPWGNQLYVFKLVFYHRKDPCLFDGVPMGTGIAGEAQPPRVCMLIFFALLQAAPVDPSGRDMKKLQAAVNGGADPSDQPGPPASKGQVRARDAPEDQKLAPEPGAPGLKPVGALFIRHVVVWIEIQKNPEGQSTSFRAYSWNLVPFLQSLVVIRG